MSLFATISRAVRRLLPVLAIAALIGCASSPAPTPTPPPTAKPITKPLPQPRIGIALGGGAAKGFAHIGVIKILEANGIRPVVVAGTSAGSVVGVLYASGRNAFELQQLAGDLHQAQLRDVSLLSGGLIKGQKLQDYINSQIAKRPIERLPRPFAAVATQLETGRRTVFRRGNAGQAVRASSSIPGVFVPVSIGGFNYVDGGIVSPVPVDAARELGADIVIAVDISTKASGKTPDSLMGIVNQSIAIMGQKLGAQELARAEVVIRPRVASIGPAEFERRNEAMLEGEKAALAALPQLRAQIAAWQRVQVAKQAPLPAPKPAPEPECAKASALENLIGKSPNCKGE
jgi:NTE family protein